MVSQGQAALYNQFITEQHLLEPQLPNAQVNPRCAARVTVDVTPNPTAAHVGLNRLLGMILPDNRSKALQTVTYRTCRLCIRYAGR